MLARHGDLPISEQRARELTSTQFHTSGYGHPIEYAKRGIRINVNCPGLVDTPLIAKMLVESKDFADHLVDSHPIGRIAKASEIVAVQSNGRSDTHINESVRCAQ